jgi:hypothetical protein
MSSPFDFEAVLVAATENKKPPTPTLTTPFCIATLGEKVWSVLSFQLLAPERNCVLVSAHVPINPCK